MTRRRDRCINCRKTQEMCELCRRRAWLKAKRWMIWKSKLASFAKRNSGRAVKSNQPA